MSLMHTEPWETSIVHVGFWLSYNRMTHAQKNIRASGKGNCVYVHWPLRPAHTSKGASFVCLRSDCLSAPQNNSNNYCGRILMNFRGGVCHCNDPDPRTFSGIFTTAILNLWKLPFWSRDRYLHVILHLHSEIHINRSIWHRDVAKILFSIWRPSAILNLNLWDITSYCKNSGVELHK